MNPLRSRLMRSVALATAIGAFAAPAASAIPTEDFIPDSRGTSPDSAVPVRVVQVRADSGFDWGDAGIGASGVLALIAISAGTAVATGRLSLGHDPQPIR